MRDIELWQGDCLELMKNIPDCSVNSIIADPPYGTKNWTKEDWDNVINIKEMFAQIKRILKPRGSALLFGMEPFSSLLRIENLEDFKYDLIWYKDRKTGFFNCNVKPLKQYEIISIFSSGTTSPGRINNMLYKPQGLIEVNNKIKQNKKGSYSMHCSVRKDKEYIQKFKNYPSDIINFDFTKKERGFHQTQKPVLLMEYLIKTYTNEGDKVLDFTMGSGTTGVACKNLNRKFIGIELDENYFNIAENRING